MGSKSKFFVACIATFVAFASAAFELKPGVTSRIPCDGAPELTYDLFIPSAYMSETERKFPVLFISNPGARPDIRAHTAWAERRGFVLVTINDSRNGNWEPVFKAQEAVWKSAEAHLRLHACLRFAIGMSGAASASWMLCAHHPNNFAGIVMEGHSGTGDAIPNYVAVAYIHGDKEPNLPVIEINYAHLRRAGNPLQRFVKRGGHIPGSVEEEERFLDWMYDLQRFGHPKLSADDRAKAKAEALAQLDAAAKIANSPERLAAFEKWLNLPYVAGWNETKPHFTPWLKALLEVESAAAEKSEKYALLGPANFRGWLKHVDPAVKTAFEKELADLKTDPAVKIAFDADTAYAKAAEAEKNAGDNVFQLRGALVQYEAVIQRWPDSAAAKRAKDDVLHLKPAAPNEPRIGIAK
ncbi:MAG TPA: hypothetical protein VKX17_25155 [Planctomycetota bacterium]|nr:hypothetical protein [Planctomycetota bacterium]